MKTKLKKIGNSIVIVMPKYIIKSLNLNISDELNIKQEENKIIVTALNKKKVSLEEKFKKYNGENLTKDFSWEDD